MNFAPSMPARESARAPIGPWLAALLVAAAGAYGLVTLWGPLNSAWSDIYGAFSHGYLALGLCIWLGVTYWRRHPPREIRPNWIGAVALLALILVVVAMELLFLQSSRLVLLPPLILASLMLIYGSESTRVLLWPIMFLYCALPQWWVINSTLQTLTTRSVSGLIDVTHLAAYVEGNFIHVPAGVFEIASGCSGLNYLVAAVSLAAFYAFMYLAQWRNRMLLIAVAAAAAMLSNFARVYALVVIGIVTDMQHYLIRVEHLYFGWVLFILAMLPVLWLARRLDDAECAVRRDEANVRCTHDSRASVSPKVMWAAALAALILVLPRFAHLPAADTTAEVAGLPSSLGRWSDASALRSAWRPSFVNATEERRVYSAGDERVEVYRAVYTHQTSESRVVRADNDFSGMGWRLAEQRSSGPEVTGFGTVMESRGYLGDQERMMWSWYLIAGHPANGKLQAKLREVQGVLHRRRDAMALAVATDCVPNCEAARARLRAFTQESLASLRQP